MVHLHCIVQDYFRIYLGRISCLQLELNGSTAMCGGRNDALNISLMAEVGVLNLCSDQLSAGEPN